MYMSGARGWGYVCKEDGNRSLLWTPMLNDKIQVPKDVKEERRL